MAKVEDIRVQIGWWSHRKYRRLSKAMGVDAPLKLMRLWAWAGPERHKGVLYDMTKQDIADEALWDHPEITAEDFVDALVEIKLLDKGEEWFEIHDWAEHQKWAYETDKRATKGQKGGLAKAAKRRATMSSAHIATSRHQANTGTPQADASSAPIPTLPTHSEPNHNNSKIMHPVPQDIEPIEHFESWLKEHHDKLEFFAERRYLNIGGWEWAKKLVDEMRAFIESNPDNYRSRLGDSGLWLSTFGVFCRNEKLRLGTPKYTAKQERDREKNRGTRSTMDFEPAGKQRDGS